MKRTVILTEEALRKIIKESIEEVILKGTNTSVHGYYGPNNDDKSKAAADFMIARDLRLNASDSNDKQALMYDDEDGQNMHKFFKMKADYNASQANRNQSNVDDIMGTTYDELKDKANDFSDYHKNRIARRNLKDYNDVRNYAKNKMDNIGVYNK